MVPADSVTEFQEVISLISGEKKERKTSCVNKYRLNLV